MSKFPEIAKGFRSRGGHEEISSRRSDKCVVGSALMPEPISCVSTNCVFKSLHVSDEVYRRVLLKKAKAIFCSGRARKGSLRLFEICLFQMFIVSLQTYVLNE